MLARMVNLWLHGFLSTLNAACFALVLSLWRSNARRHADDPYRRRKAQRWAGLSLALNGGAFAWRTPFPGGPAAAFLALCACAYGGVVAGERWSTRRYAKRGLEAIEMTHGRVVMLTTDDAGEWVDAPVVKREDNGTPVAALRSDRPAMLYDRRPLRPIEHVRRLVRPRTIDPRILAVYDDKRQAWLYRDAVRITTDGPGGES